MIRFNREKLGVENPKEEMVMAALMNGIKIKGKLMAELAQKPTLTTIHQIISKVEEFIN
jgi:hypothetical protein